MIGVKISMRGGMRSRDIPGRLMQEMERGLRSAIVQSVNELRVEAQESMLNAPEPSKPGRPPRRVSGRLASSLFSRLGRNSLSGAVGTALDYGQHLEFGTRRMPARPWLGPAYARLRPRMIALLRSAIGNALREVARR